MHVIKHQKMSVYRVQFLRIVTRLYLVCLNYVIIIQKGYIILKSTFTVHLISYERPGAHYDIFCM